MISEPFVFVYRTEEEWHEDDTDSDADDSLGLAESLEPLEIELHMQEET